MRAVILASEFTAFVPESVVAKTFQFYMHGIENFGGVIDCVVALICYGFLEFIYGIYARLPT